MARVFLSQSEKYVDVPDASFSLADICSVFEVDPSSAYINKAKSGTVVATRPHDTLPEFSGTIEYVLCAARSGGDKGHSSNNPSANISVLPSNAGDNADHLQFTVLRMAQLVESLEDRDTEISDDGETQEVLRELTSYLANGGAQTGRATSKKSLFVSTEQHYHPSTIASVLNGFRARLEKEGKVEL